MLILTRQGNDIKYLLLLNYFEGFLFVCLFCFVFNLNGKALSSGGKIGKCGFVFELQMLYLPFMALGELLNFSIPLLPQL